MTLLQEGVRGGDSGQRGSIARQSGVGCGLRDGHQRAARRTARGTVRLCGGR